MFLADLLRGLVLSFALWQTPSVTLKKNCVPFVRFEPLLCRVCKKQWPPKEALRKEVSMSSEKEHIQNGGNPCKIRISAVFYACLPIICGINLQADSLDNLCR